MRIVYFGSPQTAVPPLIALHEAGHEVVLVVSAADKRRGRGLSRTPTPVKRTALELGLAVTDDMTRVSTVEADLGVVVAYGRIIPAALLDRLKMVNIHFSLLPRWRGAAPIERAILEGDTETGVCLMDVAPQLDTGAIYSCERVRIGPGDTAADLHRRLSELGAEMLVRTLESGLGNPEPQSVAGATYASKISQADLELVDSLSVEQFRRVVRVGGAWTTFRGRRLKIHDAEPVERAVAGADAGAGAERAALAAITPVAGLFVDDDIVELVDGSVRLLTVQPEGKGSMSALEWSRGARPSGERLGS